MQNRRQFLASSYYLIWAVLLTAFVAIGAREVWIGSRGNFVSCGPFATSDAYLEELLRVPNASEQYARIIGNVSGNQIIYFCPRGDPKGDFMHGLLNYLSWPQQMRMVEVAEGELEKELSLVDRKSVSVLIFFGLQAPSQVKGWRLGPNLFIVPLGSLK